MESFCYSFQKCIGRMELKWQQESFQGVSTTKKTQFYSCAFSKDCVREKCPMGKIQYIRQLHTHTGSFIILQHWTRISSRNSACKTKRFSGFNYHDICRCYHLWVSGNDNGLIRKRVAEIWLVLTNSYLDRGFIIDQVIKHGATQSCTVLIPTLHPTASAHLGLIDITESDCMKWELSCSTLALTEH